jgi:hypothetical protein
MLEAGSKCCAFYGNATVALPTQSLVRELITRQAFGAAPFWGVRPSRLPTARQGAELKSDIHGKKRERNRSNESKDRHIALHSGCDSFMPALCFKNVSLLRENDFVARIQKNSGFASQKRLPIHANQRQ